MLVEDNAFRSQPVQVRGAHPVAAITGKVADAQTRRCQNKNSHMEGIVTAATPTTRNSATAHQPGSSPTPVFSLIL